MLTSLLIICFGLIIGSFLNVVIYRLPRPLLEPELSPQRFNLCVPRSHCPRCQHPLAARHLIPLLSYLCQRGQCRYCQQRIHWHYPLVELATALLFLLAVQLLGISVPALLLCIGFALLLCLSVIDMQHQLLPDSLNGSLLWLGLLANLHGQWCPLPQAVLGAIAGYLFLWLLATVGEYWAQQPVLGGGDAKLLAASGAWLGIWQLPWVLLIGATLTLLASIPLALHKKQWRKLRIAFGPGLAIATAILLVTTLLWPDRLGWLI